jgi:hypothetical protein
MSDPALEARADWSPTRMLGFRAKRETDLTSQNLRGSQRK